MSQELKKLKKLGAQKIHEDTHIALRHVQSVIHESFEDLDKIQFMGFVSIFQREYNLDLSTLKEKGLAYFSEQNQHKDLNTKIFVSPKKTKNFTWFYIIISLLVFIFAVYYTTMRLEVDNNETVIDNSAIEYATKNIIPKEEKKEIALPIPEVDLNVSETDAIDTNDEENLTLKTPVVEKVQPQAQELIITPNSRVWIGYINKSTGKKRQTVTKNKIILDASQDWLLSLGHTHVKINIDKRSVKIPSSNKSMQFLYKDNVLKPLSVKEFKKLNKGRIW